MLDDVVDSHGDRQGRRGTAIGVVVAMGVAAAVLVWRADDPPTPARATATASPTPSETDPLGYDPAPVTPAPDAVVVPETPAPGPTSIAARPWSGPRDTLLVVREGALLSLGEGPPRTLGRAPYGPTVIPVRGGTIVADPAVTDATDRGSVRFYPDGGGASVVLESSAVVLPSLDRSAVWLGYGATPDGPVDLRLVDARTGAVRRTTRTPAGRLWPIAEVTNGLVLSDQRSQAVVWSPTRHRVVLRFAHAVWEARGRYALVGPAQHCDGSCYAVADVETGRSRPVKGLFFPRLSLTISPDGRWVAAWAEGTHGGLPRLVVHDVRRGRDVEIPGTEVSEDVTPEFAWSRDGRTLYVALSTFGHDSGQVLAWRVGTRELRAIYDRAVEALVVA